MAGASGLGTGRSGDYFLVRCVVSLGVPLFSLVQTLLSIRELEHKAFAFFRKNIGPPPHPLSFGSPLHGVYPCYDDQKMLA